MSIVIQHRVDVPVDMLEQKGSFFLSRVRRLVKEAKRDLPELVGYQLEDIGFAPADNQIMVNLYFYPDNGKNTVSLAAEKETRKIL